MSAEGLHKVYDQLEGVAFPEQAEFVVGHDDEIGAIRHQITIGKLPGAVLLHGPYGIGKATLAFTLARDILEATGDEPRDRVSEQIAAGVHPNMFVLRRKERDTGSGFYANIRVEDVRELQGRMRQTRGRAGYRLCIIDSIDDCNSSAANALLKILEEPPAETIFFLISHRPGRLLPTIRSRCHAYALRGLDSSALQQVLGAQEVSQNDDNLAWAITLCGGRPRRAFEALLLSGGDVLERLQKWLLAPADANVATHLDLADRIVAADAAEAAFARELITNWMADESLKAAGEGQRIRLASATQLWDKARTMLGEADSYNLDMRQTLVSIFDALRQHSIRFQAAPVG